MAVITAALEPTVVVRAVLNSSARSSYYLLISLCFLSLVSSSTSFLSLNHFIISYASGVPMDSPALTNPCISGNSPFHFLSSSRLCPPIHVYLCVSFLYGRVAVVAFFCFLPLSWYGYA